MSYVRTKTSSGTGGLLQRAIDFLVKNWLFCIALFIAYPVAKKFLRKAAASDKQSQLEMIADDPQLLNQELSQVTNNAAIHKAAKDIYEAFGWDAWDFGLWVWDAPTEDDQKIYLAITSVTGSYGNSALQLLSDAYYLVSAGRDLQADCTAKLDAQYYNLINW